MRRIRIAEADFFIDSRELPAELARAHATHARPLCLCCTPAAPLYVAQIGGRYILKRMPETGPQHDPGCDSYEPPYELSGFGHVAGTAIRENVDDGVTQLKLNFSLSKGVARAAARPTEPGDAGAVASDGAKLSLRGLLHYLWDQAEFNRWRPGMAGKRNWAVIRKFLLEAAQGKTAKGRPLPDGLFIPEMFHSDHEAEITQRRIAFMNRVGEGPKRQRSLLLLIGEVKDIAPARFGHRLMVKHLPKFPFLLNEELHRRMIAKFANEFLLWEARPDAHLIAIATFGVSSAGIAVIEAMALMAVTENWIPFEHSYDAALIDALTHRRASYLKGLRYNLSAAQPLASVVLCSPGAAPVAMYIVPPDANDDFRTALEELTARSDAVAWIWMAGEAEMPPLPL